MVFATHIHRVFAILGGDGIAMRKKANGIVPWDLAVMITKDWRSLLLKRVASLGHLCPHQPRVPMMVGTPLMMVFKSVLSGDWKSFAGIIMSRVVRQIVRAA